MHAQLFGGIGHDKIIDADFIGSYTLLTRHFPANPPLFAPLTPDAPPLHRDEVTEYHPLQFEYRGALIRMYVPAGTSEDHARTLWRDMLESEAKYYPSKGRGIPDIPNSKNLPDWQYGGCEL